jgi:imidazolonepropionase-like amidohydrolase
VRVGRLIDGLGNDSAGRVLVLVENERVAAVVPDVGGTLPDGYEVLDASDYTVMPGLIDAHLHLDSSSDPGERSLPGPIGHSIPSYTLSCYRNALKDLENGFTTVRVAGSQHYADVALRDQVNAGLLMGPRIWAAEQGITSTSGHMDRAKVLPPHVSSIDNVSAVADGPVEARRAVRVNLRFDVDYIKINATLTEHVRR